MRRRRRGAPPRPVATKAMMVAEKATSALRGTPPVALNCLCPFYPSGIAHWPRRVRGEDHFQTVNRSFTTHEPPKGAPDE